MNSGDLGSLISGVMSDPEMMNKIKALSEGLADSAVSEESAAPSLLPEKAVSDGGKAKNRAALIRALMPYLNVKRREKADMLLKIMNLADLKDLI